MTAITLTPRQMGTEKLISLFFALSACLLLPPGKVINLFIIMGLGHIYLSHWYQYQTGKTSIAAVIGYILTFSIIAGLYSAKRDFHLLLVVTGCYVVLHILIDEKHLLGEKPSLLNACDVLSPFLIYSQAILQTTYEFYLSPWFSVAPAILLVILRIIFTKHPHRSLLMTQNGGFLTATLVLAGLLLSEIKIQLEYWLAFVGLFHYMVWYIRYFFRTAKNPQKHKTYIWDTILINTLLIGLYAFYKMAPERGFWLAVFYRQDFFYIWTLLHLIFTSRKTDLRYFSLKTA